MIKPFINRINCFLFAHRKVLFIFTIIYFLILITYDIVFLKRNTQSMIMSYLLALIVCVFAWFGVRFVLWVQIKNSFCTEDIFNIISLIAMFVFIVSSVILGIEYFVNDFVVAAFVCPTAFLSAVDVQKYRKEYYK